MEPGEVQNLQLSNLSTDVDSVSPRRQVETSRRVMPGGTIVTTTTTTTEKPKDIRLDSSFQGTFFFVFNYLHEFHANL